MTLYENLLAGQFNGYILLAKQGSQTTFFGWDLQYGQTPQPWRLIPASFDSIVGAPPNDWKKTAGYVVCTPGEPKCWTVLGTGPYSISSRDLITTGIPDDIDIFGGEAVDKKAGTVKVSWAVRNTYLANAPDGWVFGEGTPEVFQVGFPEYIGGINSGFKLPSSIIWGNQ